MRKLADQFRKLRGKSRFIISICLFGLVASLASVAFQLAISWVYKLCYLDHSRGSFVHFAGVSLAVIVTTSLISGWLLNSACPDAAGSGVPQAKLAFWKEFGFAPK